MLQLPVYLDNHSTTRVDPRVLHVMLPCFTEKFGNAASINHSFGWEARDAVEAARSQVASLLNTDTKHVVFTSGATESNNIAIKGVVQAAGAGCHLIVNVAEHRSVLDPAKRLMRAGVDVTILPVNSFGAVDPQQVADAIRNETVLVSVMTANNEVGTINPILEIGEICRARGVLFHADAAQSIGKIMMDLSSTPIDLLTLTAHKLYGPKGVGALVVRRGAPRVQIAPLFDGGGHENHLRSGTLPVPLIVGFGQCCELASQVIGPEAASTGSLLDRLWNGLRSEIDGIRLNGHPSLRLPGNLNVSFEGVDGEALMASLKDIAVSSGSACTSADPEPSHVLRAMGLNDALTRASLRFGVGRFNTAEEIDFAIGVVAESVRRLRAIGSAPA